MREFRTHIERCPVCGSEGTCHFTGRIHDIPYFGETIESLIYCTSCGFKHSDVMHTEEREPARYEFEISSADDMTVRVVRSSTGVIEIPTLGVSISPGPSSQGFISNIEGVLNRVADAILAAMTDAPEDRRKAGEEKLRMIEEIKEGKRKATIVIWDERGLSAIVHPKARRSTKLSRL
jgi:zinc finger protein